MGERLGDGDFKVMSSSTTDLLQKLNQSIQSVEQEIRVQQAVVHMGNLKVLVLCVCKSFAARPDE